METHAHNRILSDLARRDAREVYEMARPVGDLIATQGWEIISGMIQREIQLTRATMEMEGVHEHVEYATMTGKIRGLRYAEIAIEAVMEASKRAEQVLLDSASQTGG